MDIRPLTPRDLPVLLDLAIETFGPFYEDSYRPLVGDTVFRNRHGEWREDYRRHLAALDNPEAGRSAAVAEDGGSIVGFIGWVVQPDQAHGEIDIIAVSPSARRRGIGKALVEHAVAQLKDSGARVISIGTGGDDFHAAARALYEALGFTPFPIVNYTKAV
ncbi:GNAT family N-acetyltransferase [Arthrobacter mobilis]|uniref:GNAT family N-acetyltransferase n=1 Tax=Arthrobacter mobilis TaxID=2724944 RepID=A0A7X6HE02_9MICC|nr:GNAT family N-acetyltransferase [Arthrobacter mobilis]NKX55384.1 GNAT family N-acetyltransferase [Arthrobacter mobilis]